MNDEFERAIAIGEENRDLIALGKAWCTNIRNDRSGFGVGMVEQMTGLPISGGRFACDHAKEPAGMAGMRLEVSAVGFYETNCVGCEARVSGNRLPNLSTWAEPQIRQRRESEELQVARQADEEESRHRRADTRRLLAASFSAAAQEVVELISALDDPGVDDQPAESLRAVVQLSPEVFDEPLQAVLLTECRTLASSVLLDAIVNLQEVGALSDIEGAHALAIDAVKAGWGLSPGARYLARAGRRGDVCDELVDALVNHSAAGRSIGSYFGSSRGHPRALLHYHQLDAPAVENRISVLLRHGAAWRRSNAAEAASAVVGQDNAAGLRLMTALFDSLKHPDSRYHGEGSADEVTAVVGSLFVLFPEDVHAAIDHLWNRATASYRYKLLRCYDQPFRSSRSEEQHAAAARLAISRAIEALSGADIEESDIDEDYQRRAIDVLEMAIPRANQSDLSLDSLLGVLLDWIGRAKAHAALQPQSEMDVLEIIGASTRADWIVRGLSDAIATACSSDPQSALSACEDVFGSDVVDVEVRAEVVRVVGRLVSSAPDAISQALPMIYRAVLGEHQLVRSAGIEAAGEAIRSLGQESIPPLLAEAVFAGLSDQYLIVVGEAVQVVCRLPVDLLPTYEATIRLLHYAKAYSSDRLRTRSVQEALRGALRFASSDPRFNLTVASSILQIIDDMPPYEAREALSGLRKLRDMEGWVSTAIEAMRPDENYQYESLGDSEKEFLMRSLGGRRLTDEELNMLLAVESAAQSHDRDRALMFADVFCESLRADLGERVMARYWEAIPETTERRMFRRAVRLELLRYATEVAVVKADAARSHSILTEMVQLAEEMDGEGE